MACIELPKPAIPKLPSPFSIAPPALPSVSVDASLCCKLVQFTGKLPITLPAATFNPTVIKLINAAIDVINDYKLALPLKCPLE